MTENTNRTISKFFELPWNKLQIPKMPVKILALLQAAELLSP